MKKNGWGLSTMIMFCAVIGVCLIFSVVLYKSNVEKTIEKGDDEATIVSKTYLGLEEDIALFSKEYFNSNEKKDVVTIKKLVELGYMSSVYDLKDSLLKCSGYVEKTSVDEKNSYKTFLKCGSNYETAGYLESLDE